MQQHNKHNITSVKFLNKAFLQTNSVIWKLELHVRPAKSHLQDKLSLVTYSFTQESFAISSFRKKIFHCVFIHFYTVCGLANLKSEIAKLITNSQKEWYKAFEI